MYYVYVFGSDKLNKRYTGSTEDIPKRIAEHNRGCNKFTKGGIPWNIIYSEEYFTKQKALEREKFLKSGQGRKFLDEILKSRKGAGVV